MQINLYATFRLLAHTRSLTLDLPPGTNVRAAVDAVVAALPVLRSHWLDDAGELYAHVHIFLNGDDLTTLPGGIDTPLRPADTLDFFPPVAGGSSCAGKTRLNISFSG